MLLARTLIESRMPQKSLRQLQLSTGIGDIPDMLQSAAKAGRLPKRDYLERIHRATAIPLADMFWACAVDAGFDQWFACATAPEDVRMVEQFLTATPEEKRLVAAQLAYLIANRRP